MGIFRNGARCAGQLIVRHSVVLSVQECSVLPDWNTRMFRSELLWKPVGTASHPTESWMRVIMHEFSHGSFFSFEGLVYCLFSCHQDTVCCS